MEIKVKNYNYQSSLISSIIIFIAGAILWYNPEIFITTISKIIGILLLLATLINFFTILKQNKNAEKPSNIKYLGTIILLTLTILFLFFSEAIEETFRIVAGFWIVYTGINRLITSLQSKKLSLTIVAALLILVGIYSIVVGDIVIRTLGIILMVYAIIDIVGYVLYKKDDKTDIEISESTTLITTKPKEEEKKKTRKIKKIKDVESEEK